MAWCLSVIGSTDTVQEGHEPCWHQSCDGQGLMASPQLPNVWSSQHPLRPLTIIVKKQLPAVKVSGLVADCSDVGDARAHAKSGKFDSMQISGRAASCQWSGGRALIAEVPLFFRSRQLLPDADERAQSACSLLPPAEAARMLRAALARSIADVLVRRRSSAPGSLTLRISKPSTSTTFNFDDIDWLEPTPIDWPGHGSRGRKSI